MQFNKHSELAGLHAFLSPSNYHWINYDNEKLDDRVVTAEAAKIGTKKHEFAQMAINLGEKLPKNGKTLNMYVNDVIGYRMSPEVVLFYSPNCFGTADGLGFNRNTLRIFDLKTGESKTSVNQLLVYGALFCLEYGFKPFDIEYDLRIYQLNEIQKFETDPADVAVIMDKIITFDKRIDAIRREELF